MAMMALSGLAAVFEVISWHHFASGQMCVVAIKMHMTAHLKNF